MTHVSRQIDWVNFRIPPEEQSIIHWLKKSLHTTRELPSVKRKISRINRHKSEDNFFRFWSLLTPQCTCTVCRCTLEGAKCATWTASASVLAWVTVGGPNVWGSHKPAVPDVGDSSYRGLREVVMFSLPRQNADGLARHLNCSEILDSCG